MSRKKQRTGNPLRSEGGVIRVMAEGVMASRIRVSRTKISSEPYRQVARLLEQYRTEGLKSFNAGEAVELGAMHVALGLYLLDNPEALHRCPTGLRPYSPKDDPADPDLQDNEVDRDNDVEQA